MPFLLCCTKIRVSYTTGVAGQTAQAWRIIGHRPINVPRNDLRVGQMVLAVSLTS